MHWNQLWVRRSVMWLAVAVWMATLFSLSSQTAPESAGLSGGIIITALSIIQPGFSMLPPAEQLAAAEPYQHLVRKGAHFFAYFVLGLLTSLALTQHALRARTQFLLALGVACIYAASDEIHQLSVAGRGAMASDVLIDSAGALLGVSLKLGAERLWKKRRAR